VSVASTAPTGAPQATAPAVPETWVSDSPEARVRAAKDRWTAIHAAIQLAREIPPGERRAWLDVGRFRHADPLVMQMFILELEELLFQADPYALVAWELASGRRSASKHLQRLARQDADGLIAFGQSFSDPVQGRSMIFAALKELVSRDSDRVLKLALDFPPPPDSDDLPMEMVRLLAEAGEANAGKLLNLAETKGDRWRGLLRASAARAMVAKDFGSGLKWLCAEPDAALLYTGAFGINGSTMEEMRGNARKLAENLDLLPDGFARVLNRAMETGGWPNVLDMGGGEELWLAADLGRLGIGSREQGQIRIDLVDMLAKDNLAAALKYLADPALFGTKQRKDALRKIHYMQQLRGKDMPAEMRAALTEDEAKMIAEMDALYQKNQAAPKKPLTVPEQFVAAMNDAGSDALHLRSENWAPEDLDQALAYVRDANPELLAELTKRIMRTGYPLKPLAAEIYKLALVNNIASLKVREELIETAIHWGDSDPVRAAAWAESLPAGPERLRSLQNIAAQWNRDDPAGAERWISTLKDKTEAEAAREAVRIFDAKVKAGLSH
jgi:hypothetical protein